MSDAAVGAGVGATVCDTVGADVGAAVVGSHLPPTGQTCCSPAPTKLTLPPQPLNVHELPVSVSRPQPVPDTALLSEPLMPGLDRLHVFFVEHKRRG